MLQNVDSLFMVVTHELTNAPSEVVHFKKISKAEIIWPLNPNQDIGLKYDQKSKILFRYEGIYDKEKKEWTSKRRSIIAKKIDVVFEIFNLKSFIAFTCKISFDSFEFSRTIIPRNHIYGYHEKNKMFRFL